MELTPEQITELVEAECKRLSAIIRDKTATEEQREEARRCLAIMFGDDADQEEE